METNKPLDLLTVEEAMAELRVQVSTLYKAMNDGRIKALRVKGTDKVLIPRAELIGMLEEWKPRPGGRKPKDKTDTTAE